MQAPAPTYKNETIFSAAEMGLFRDSTYLNPIDTTKECFASYCNELGGCPSCNSSVLQELGGPNTYLAISACITNLCDTITGSLDSDLGGVGVSFCSTMLHTSITDGYLGLLVVCYSGFPLLHRTHLETRSS